MSTFYGTMPHSLSGQVCVAASLLVFLFATIRGSTPEKIVGVTGILNTILYGLLQDKKEWLDPQHRLMLISMGTFAVYAALISTWKRRWLIPVTACQFLTVVVQLITPYLSRVDAHTFLGADNALCYCILVSLAWGTLRVRAHREPATPRPKKNEQ